MLFVNKCLHLFIFSYAASFFRNLNVIRVLCFEQVNYMIRCIYENVCSTRPCEVIVIIM